jgi:hypothetical protein
VDVQARKLARPTIMKAKSKTGILNFMHQNEYNFTLSKQLMYEISKKKFSFTGFIFK